MTKQTVFHREGVRGQVIVEGTLVLDMHWRGLDELANQIKAMARQCEAEEKAEELIADTAILYRSGAPFGLSAHPDIRHEAMKGAHWGSDLRRYLPFSVPSAEAFGTPTLIQEART